MEELQIQYSKEIANELGKVAVYLPGEEVEVGDIIKFPNAKSRFFGKKLPFGSFRKITTLKNLGVRFSIPDFSDSPDSYRFSSKNGVNFGLNLQGKASLGNDSTPNVSKDFKIQFFSEGALLFLALDCKKQELDDILFLEKEINSKGKELVWDDTYLVTSVTVAKKAFIAQSRSKSSEIYLKASIDEFKSPIASISLDTNLKVLNSSGDLFVMDWSDNVTVFMDLIRFEKKVFQKPNIEHSRGENSNEQKLFARRVNIKQELLKSK